MIGRLGDNMNRKGQALVEFVLILPVLIFILFAIIDFGIIFSTTHELENNSADIIGLFKNGTSIDEIKEIYPDVKINISDEVEFYRFTISTSVKLITPGFNRIFGNPYKINVERVLPYA